MAVVIWSILVPNSVGILTPESGSSTNSTATENIPGLMVPFTRAIGEPRRDTG